MLIGIMEHIKHALSGDLSEIIRLELVGDAGKIPLSFFKTVYKILVMLIDKRLKKLLFAVVISIKGAGSHIYFFDNVP